MYKQIEGTKVLNIVERMKGLIAEFENEIAAAETVEETTATVAETEIIEHEGLKLKRVDREAREGDYVRLVGNTSAVFDNSKIYGPVYEKDEKLKINTIDGDRFNLYRECYNRTPSTVEVFEVIDVQAEQLPFPEVELTANQKRAKLIEKAKQFVEEHINKNYPAYKGYNSIWFTNDGGASITDEVEFIVNSKKRTVVALIKTINSVEVRYKGIAKCAPGDVFNEHIGKAIALARALKIDVPEEFLKAVQPDEISIGVMIEVLKKNGDEIHTTGEVEKVINDNVIAFSKEHYLKTFGMQYQQTSHHGKFRILDDTNAQYKDI